MTGLLWLASIITALTVVGGAVRWVYRPTRRLIREIGLVLDRIERAADRHDQLAEDMRELAAGATAVAVRHQQQIDNLAQADEELSSRLRDLADLMLENASELRHVKEAINAA